MLEAFILAVSDPVLLAIVGLLTSLLSGGIAAWSTLRAKRAEVKSDTTALTVTALIDQLQEEIESHKAERREMELVIRTLRAESDSQREEIVNLRIEAAKLQAKISELELELEKARNSK